MPRMCYDGFMNDAHLSVQIPVIPAKSLLSPWMKEGWFGSNYNMNLFKGCNHGCIYCDSRSECYGVEDFDTVRMKEDAITILERELRSKKKKGIVISGSMSDVYNPFEKKYEQMRHALRLFDRYGFGTVIDTKSSLVERDRDLLQSILRHSPAVVNMTITTADDKLCRLVEPHVVPTSRRLQTLAKLSAAGIPCGVLLMPMLPFVNDTVENILSIVRLVKEAGAQWLYPGNDFAMTLRTNQREYYLEHIESLFPGIRMRYHQTYGMAYHCRVPNHKALWAAFTAECDRLDMLWQMPQIVARIWDGYDETQMRLW